MDKCYICGAPTCLYYNGRPICPKCDDERIDKEGAGKKTWTPVEPKRKET